MCYLVNVFGEPEVRAVSRECVDLGCGHSVFRHLSPSRIGRILGLKVYFF